MIKKIYFPGLNGIRFIAALLVIIDHTELFKSYLGLPTLWANSYSAYLGSFGVSIFFCIKWVFNHLSSSRRAKRRSHTDSALLLSSDFEDMAALLPVSPPWLFGDSLPFLFSDSPVFISDE